MTSFRFFRKLTAAEVGNTKTHEVYIRMPNDFDFELFFNNTHKENGSVIDVDFSATVSSNIHPSIPPTQATLRFVFFANSNKEKRIPSLGDIFNTYNVKEGDSICLEKNEDHGTTSFNLTFLPSDTMQIYNGGGILLSGDYDQSLSAPLYQPSNTGPLQIIYYGAPGTGKSYKIKNFLKQNNVPEENIFRTTFHPDSDYSSFVGAYKPTMQKRYRYDGKVKAKYYEDDDLAGKKKDEFMVDKTIEYSFIPQAFLNAYMQAYRTSENVYLIIEEINRGNCAQIFGDLFQLLDRDENGYSEYPIKADADLKAFLEEELGKDNDGIKNGKLRLPSNLYIYATMNTSDQSLFPIDSAFKRRWDWEYEPIKYENTDWVINIQGNKFSWVSFQKEINKRIFDTTHSEDKMIGDYFVNPSDKVVDDRLLLNKVLFYLWNDVCKDGEGDIFKTSDTEEVSFSGLHGEDGIKNLIAMMRHLLKNSLVQGPVEEIEEEEEDDDAENNKRYSINGAETDENGKAWGKGALVKRAVEIYRDKHPEYTAAQIRDVWIAANFKIPHIVETDEDRATRLRDSIDSRAEKRSKEIKLSNGESLHVSTQAGDGIHQRFSDFLSKIHARPDWGITIQEL